MTTAGQIAFDASALTGRLSRGRARKQLREAGYRGTSTAGYLWGLALTGVGFLAIGTPVALWVASLGSEWWVLPLIFAIIGAILVVVSIALAATDTSVRRARLARFAESNAMSYSPWGSTNQVGSIFSIGTAGRVEDVVRGTAPRFVEFGNLSYELDDKRRKWGYICIHLDAPLPHIVLDGHANNRFGRSNLPLRFPDAVDLTLEGEFGSMFDLLCPPGYEHDALYLFTPDIMERFVDRAAEVDVEIVDDRLFIYLQDRDGTPTDPRQWAWMFSMVAALIGKLDQWGRWRDDRLSSASASAAPVIRPPRGVADEGRRMRRRRVITVASVIGGILLGGFYVLYISVEVLGLF